MVYLLESAIILVERIEILRILICHVQHAGVVIVNALRQGIHISGPGLKSGRPGLKSGRPEVSVSEGPGRWPRDRRTRPGSRSSPGPGSG